jgi:predicted TPR repeat methyltransferase
MNDEGRSNVSVTLASYEERAEAYLQDSTSTSLAVYEEFLCRVVSLLPGDAQMLELGSGPGRDALFFDTNGVAVRRTDGALAFIEWLRASGHRADLLEVTADEFGGPFDIVFANAVLLHLTVNQLDDVLTKAARAVGPKGLLAFTVKEGECAAWTTAKIDKPRYFAYWSEAAMRTHLTANGWEPLSIAHEWGRTEPWLFIVCQKKPQ